VTAVGGSACGDAAAFAAGFSSKGDSAVVISNAMRSSALLCDSFFTGGGSAAELLSLMVAPLESLRLTMLVGPQALLSIATGTLLEVLVIVVTEECLSDNVAWKLLVARWRVVWEYSPSLLLIL